MWPVTAKVTFKPILHVSEMYKYHSDIEKATSSQVVLECYHIVSGQLIIELANRGQGPELYKFIILYKYWSLMGL